MIYEDVPIGASFWYCMDCSQKIYHSTSIRYPSGRYAVMNYEDGEGGNKGYSHGCPRRSGSSFDHSIDSNYKRVPIMDQIPSWIKRHYERIAILGRPGECDLPQCTCPIQDNGAQGNIIQGIDRDGKIRNYIKCTCGGCNCHYVESLKNKK